MKQYPWLRTHFEQLIPSYQTGRRGHHALLIQAVPGMGDDALIYAITRFLLCQQPEGYKSCEKCRGCQLMQAGTHPDYYHISNQKKGKSALNIDDIRDVSEKLYEHAHLGGAKVVQLNNIALLTEVAIHALLKTLEEPPKKTWFFLSYLESGYLLATLRSRCRLYYLTVPQEEWALDWLQQEVTVSQNAALTALRLCCGAPAAALELLQGNYWTQRAELCSALSNVLEGYDWLSLLAVLNQEQATLAHLQWLIALLLDALKIQHGATVITNVDVQSLVNNLAEIFTGTTLHAIIHTLCQCRKQLLTVTNLNHELVLIDRLLTIEHYLKSGTVLPASYSLRENYYVLG